MVDRTAHSERIAGLEAEVERLKIVREAAEALVATYRRDGAVTGEKYAALVRALRGVDRG